VVRTFVAQLSGYVVWLFALADKFAELAVACLLHVQAVAYKMSHGRSLPRPLP
jgi:hypothetical protein